MRIITKVRGRVERVDPMGNGAGVQVRAEILSADDVSVCLKDGNEMKWWTIADFTGALASLQPGEEFETAVFQEDRRDRGFPLRLKVPDPKPQGRAGGPNDRRPAQAGAYQRATGGGSYPQGNMSSGRAQANQGARGGGVTGPGGSDIPF